MARRRWLLPSASDCRHQWLAYHAIAPMRAGATGTSEIHLFHLLRKRPRHWSWVSFLDLSWKQVLRFRQSDSNWRQALTQDQRSPLDRVLLLHVSVRDHREAAWLLPESFCKSSSRFSSKPS